MLHSLSRAALVLALASQASAQTFHFQIQPATSGVAVNADVSLLLPGSVIGNYDAVNNPTGTRTLPGLFGGSGNQPVPMDITLIVDLGLIGQASGSFQAQVDVLAGTIAIDGLTLDAQNGIPGGADLTLELLYQTFRTFQPTSLFPGGVPLPLPLGQAGVTGLAFSQIAPGAGVLVPDPVVADNYSVTALVPVEVSFTVDALGQVIPVGPLPLVLPIAGTLFHSDGFSRLSLSIQQATTQSLPDPFPGQPITDLPLAVPTVLPPGDVANLLFNAVFGQLDFGFDTTIDVIADGVPICIQEAACTSFPNSTGQVATIAALGTTSVSANDLRILCTQLPAQRIGTVLFGSQAKQLPFAAGILCVGGGQVYRLPPVRSDIFGVSTSVVDLSLPSPKYQALVPGSVWYFQMVYRDQAFGPPSGNTSNSLRIQFCP